MLKSWLESLAPTGWDTLDALTERAPIGLFVADASGDWVYANAHACELTGLARERVLGGGWVKALHPEDVERVGAAWAEASRAGADVVLEYRFSRPDRSVSWVEGTANAVQNEHGDLAGWVGILVDLTARRASEERYRQLFEHANDAMFSASTAGDFTDVNLAAERMTGFSREELLQKSFFDLVAPESRDRAHKTLSERLAVARTRWSSCRWSTRKAA